MRIHALLLARDEAHNLNGCIDSLRGAVDAVTVFDTGSHDRTAHVAREQGAECVALPWGDDFAAARNAALSHLRAEWALVIDADERLDAPACARIRAAAGGAATDVLAFHLELRTYTADVEVPAHVGLGFEAAERWGASGFVAQPEPRLLRLGCGLLYQGRVCERVCTADGTPLPIAAPTVGVLHHRRELESVSRRESRVALRLRLALQEVVDAPAAETCARLGVLLNQQRLWEAGLVYLRAAAARGARGAALDLQLGVAQLQLGLHEGAIASLRQALEEMPDHPELALWLATALLASDRSAVIDAAGELLERVLEQEPERELALVQRAVWHRRRGEIGEARAYLEALLERNPTHALGVKELGTVALVQGRLGEAERHLQRALELRPEDAEVWNNLGCCRDRLGLWSAALAAFDRAVRLAPSDPRPLRNRCIAHAACGKLGAMCHDAERALAASDDAVSLLHGLREACLDAGWLPALRRLENWAEAAGWLRAEERIVARGETLQRRA
jgi:tetratricopeptide (TPR) repeat protein